MALGILLSLFSLIAFASPIPAAKVNGSPITEEEVLQYRQTHGDISREMAMERLVLFHLAVQEAKRQKWDQDPATAREIDKALYSAFLKHSLAGEPKSLDPSHDELSQAYQKMPLLRLRVLALNNKKQMLAKLAEVRAEMAKGTAFASLVLTYSEDESAKMAGDLDFRGVHNLPETIYQAALKLKKGEISAPIAIGGSLNFVQLLDTKPFSGASGTYLAVLTSRLRSEREQQLLLASLGKLREKAAVEITAKETP